MKTLIAIVSVFSLLYLNTIAFSETNNKSADKGTPSTIKTSPTQVTKSDANTTVVKTADSNSKASAKKAVTVNTSKAAVTDTTLEQALELLRNSTTPPLKMVVLWGPMEKAGVERIAPVPMEGLSGVKLGTALKFVLDSASPKDAPLDYWIKDGVIVVGPKASRPDEHVTQFYNVCDITSAPSNPYGAMGGYNTFGNQAGAGVYGQNNYGGGAGRYGYTGGYGNNRMYPQQYGGGYGGYGGSGLYGNYGMMRTGTSLGVGGGYGGYGGGYGGYGGGYGGGMYGGGFGMGGPGMGGYGVANDPAETLYRQQQLKTLIQSTIVPNTWNP